MKASHRWLRELVPQLPDDPKEVARRLTSAGLEVEAMTTFGAASSACVVARVVSARPHPSKSGLRLVTVDRGGAQQEVVCGAPNVPEPGGLVVLAPLGTHLPAKGVTIEKRAIGGVASEGMLCSEQELGIGDDASGILILPQGIAAPGTPLSKAEGATQDTIFEIGLTPNRPDGLGHIGLAREAAGLFHVPFASPDPGAPKKTSGSAIESLVKVRIDDGERCPHYAAAAVLETTIGPSPLWLRYRLASLDVRPISNVVDITNLVMLEYGHPMHAFDLDRVGGAEIIVRRAKEGEKLRTLDGTDRVLTADDLVICDAKGPVALAGVMGGGDSEISAQTKRVLLECAYFDPRSVRRASRRHALHSESSHRFERGVDWGDTRAAMARAVALTSELAGGAAAKGTLFAEAKPLTKRTTRLRPKRADQLLGMHVPREEADAILRRLGLVAKKETPEGIEYEVPSHRPDITREEDLIEEIARVRGYDAIPTVLPAIRPTPQEPGLEELNRRARAAAVELGLSEAVTYAFVSRKVLEVLGAPAPSVVLKNPLSEDRDVMRTSILPGLLDAVARARRHGERDARLFTLGAVFLDAGEGKLPDERPTLGVVLAGDRDSYLSKPQPFDVWDGKGVATGFVERFVRRPATTRALSGEGRPKHLHPRGAAAIVVEGKDVGRFGILHPDTVDALDLDGEMIVVEIDLAKLDAVGRAIPRYVDIPRFPASTRDIALVVHDDVPAGDVLRAVRDAAGALAEDVHLFDRFVGGVVPAEHASLAFHVVYRAPDRTLTDAEVDAQHEKVVAEVKKRFGAQLRA